MLARRRLLGLAAGLAGGAALGGCGFRPVYMPAASGQPGTAQRELAAINVGLIPERPGQLLRQALQARMASDGGGLHRYDLQVTFWISGAGRAVRPDSAVTRVRLIGNANWALMAQDPVHTRLTAGNVRSFDGFDIFGSDYFAVDLENEAVQRRVAEHVADQLVSQLAIWFRNRDPATG